MDATRNPATMLHAVLTPDVKQILDQFRECFGIRIVFYDAAGQLLKSGMDQGDCRYCQLIQKLYGPERCMEQTAGAREKARSQGLLCYPCHAGLMEAVFPIHGEGYLLGCAMIGQMRSARQMPRQVARDWGQRFGTDALHKAFLAQRFVSKHHLESILGLFSILARYIVSNHLVAVKTDSRVLKAVEYMREHLHETITLQMLASHLGVSYCSLSRAFSKYLGASFKKVLTEMKLTRAEELMAGDPELTVVAVAEKLGYEDPFYFSRIYHKHRGQPPSAFLHQQRT